MLILHIPHATTCIPDAALAGYTVSEDALAEEQRKLTDWFTDQLFTTACPDAEAIVFPYSRLFIDVERFASDADEPMAARGMGVFYTQTTDGSPLRKAPTAQEREAWLKIYDTHHREMDRAVARALDQYGRALIIDCHSFPEYCLPCHNYASPSDIAYCIGTDPYHSPEWLAAQLDAALRTLSPAGRVVRNQPFSGAFVPTRYYRRDPRVHSIMIEVNRHFYMDESTATKHAGFHTTQRQLAEALQLLTATPPKR